MRCSSSTSAPAALRTSPLHDLHRGLGARLTTFAGWTMPSSYGDAPGAVRNEHLHVRRRAGLFDVSHTTPVLFDGPDRAEFVQLVTTADLAAAGAAAALPTCVPHLSGGILDTGLLVDRGEYFCLTTHAGRCGTVVGHLRRHAADFPGDVRVVPLHGCGMMDLQGPGACGALAGAVEDDRGLGSLPYLGVLTKEIAGVPCVVTRTGYTGEDGFQVMILGGGVRGYADGGGEDGHPTAGAVADAEAVAVALLEQPGVRPVGLGARDSLRLEAGLPLFGQDVAELDAAAVSEAGLAHLVSHRRRSEGGFVGYDQMLPQIEDPSAVRRRRVGFVSGAAEKGPLPRRHDKVFDAQGSPVGVITSSGVSYTLGYPISMGYVNRCCAVAGTELLVNIRGKGRPLVVTDLPFVPTKIYRG